MNKKRNILFIVLGLAFIIGVFWLPPRFNLYRAWKKYLKTEVAFKQKLNQGEFISIDDQTNLDKAISQTVQDAFDLNDHFFSKVQKETLVKRIHFLFKAYHDGTYASFSQFRYPSDINDRPEVFVPGYVQNLRDGYFNLCDVNHIPVATNAPETIALFKHNALLLETNYNLWQAAGAQWTNPIFCATCWRETAPNKIEVRMNYWTNRIGSVNEMLASENQLGAQYAPVNKLVQPTPDDILKSRKSLTSAYVHVVIRTQNPAEVVPIFVHFYWIDEYSDWIPFEFVNGYGLSKLYHLFDI
ncbi:MAG TPA: hypothetical protein VGO57_14235 [Verrucomicrobiae bacterium]|jgi:hypothetical protein